jgi:hypothetical protein
VSDDDDSDEDNVQPQQDNYVDEFGGRNENDDADYGDD